jgi:hypothetical protein
VVLGRDEGGLPIWNQKFLDFALRLGTWVGKKVEVQADRSVVQIWAGEELLAVHPRAERPGVRFTIPGQWKGLPLCDSRLRSAPTALQVGDVEVAVRPLTEYEALVVSG